MVMGDKQFHIGRKIQGLRSVSCPPILEVVPRMRTRQVNRFATAVSEVVRIVCRSPQRNCDGLDLAISVEMKGAAPWAGAAAANDRISMENRMTG